MLLFWILFGLGLLCSAAGEVLVHGIYERSLLHGVQTVERTGTVRRYADGQAVGVIRQVYRLTYRSGRVRCCRVWEGSRLAEELSRREEPPVSVAEERWKSRPEAA